MYAKRTMTVKRASLQVLGGLFAAPSLDAVTRAIKH